MKLKNLGFILFGYLCTITSLHGQQAESLWLDYTLHINKNDRLQYYGDIGYRTILLEDTETRVNFRPALRYKLNDRWSLHGGLGFFYEFRPALTNRFELRPFQGVQFNIDPLDKLRLNIYTRIEERISFDDILPEKTNVDVRFRFRLSGHYDFLNPIGDNYWFLPFSVEFFQSVEDNITELTAEQVRMFLGLGYNFDEFWRLTFLLNLEVEGRAFVPDATINNILFQLKLRREIQWSALKSKK
jgi:hypothetical protein